MEDLITFRQFVGIVVFVFTSLNCDVANTHPCDIYNDTYVDCSNAGLTVFPLNSSKTLRYLDLSNNFLTMIPDIDMPNLVKLDVSYNRISKFGNDVFVNLHNLIELDLSSNKIAGRHLRKLFLGCKKLEVINLSHNPLYTLKEDAFEATELKNVKEILLNHCNLSYIHPFALWGVASNKLTRLHLRGNKLNDSNAHEAIQNFESVRFLDIGENEFECLNGNYFRFMDYLEEILLDGNHIKAITSKSFSGLVKTLEAVNLAYNELTSFPQFNFNKFAVIKNVNLSGNPFREIQIKGRNISIENIILDHVDTLYKINAYAFIAFPKLKKLSISHCNKLTEISKYALGGVNLRHLSLKNNHLSRLSEKLVEWNKLHELYLEGNPWYCDCHLGWMVQVSVFWNVHLTCAGPLNMQGRDIRTMKASELQCISQSTKILFIGLTIAAALIVLTVVFCLLRRKLKHANGWRHYWRRMMTSCCRKENSTSNRYTSVHVYSNNIDEPTVNIIKSERTERDGESDDGAKSDDELGIGDDFAFDRD